METIAARIISDPAASYWLKRAICELSQRDPVDALNDAESLVVAMLDRVEVKR